VEQGMTQRSAVALDLELDLYRTRTWIEEAERKEADALRRVWGSVCVDYTADKRSRGHVHC
jgi:hypothetical protein